MIKSVRFFAVIGALLASGGWLFAADSGTLQKRMNQVMGTWQIAAQFREGQPVSEDEYEGAQLFIENGKFSVRRGNDVLHAGTFQLVAVEGQLSRAEVEFQQGPRAGQKFKQTSKLQTRTLTICTAPFEDEFPKEFASTSANKCFLAVYKRMQR